MARRRNCEFDGVRKGERGKGRKFECIITRTCRIVDAATAAVEYSSGKLNCRTEGGRKENKPLKIAVQTVESRCQVDAPKTTSSTHRVKSYFRLSKSDRRTDPDVEDNLNLKDWKKKKRKKTHI